MHSKLKIFKGFSFLCYIEYQGIILGRKEMFTVNVCSITTANLIFKQVSVQLNKHIIFMLMSMNTIYIFRMIGMIISTSC